MVDPGGRHRHDALLALGLSTPLRPAEASAVVGIAAEEPGLRYAAALAVGLGAPGSLPELLGLDDETDRAVAWWREVGPLVVDTD